MIFWILPRADLRKIDVVACIWEVFASVPSKKTCFSVMRIVVIGTGTGSHSGKENYASIKVDLETSTTSPASV